MKNTKLLTLAGLIILSLSAKCLAVWDKTTPAHSEALSLGDGRIRELKTDIETSLQVNGTGDFPGTNSSSPRYFPHLATMTFEPTGNDAPVNRQIINLSSSCIEMVNNVGVWTCLDVAASSSVTAGKLAADVAGLGLIGAGTLPLKLAVDTNTFAIDTDSLTVISGGIKGLQIKTGDITGLQINSTFTVSGRPAFFAYVNSQIDNITGDNSQATVPFSNEDYDNHNDLANSTFTAPVTGLYHFDACITLAENTSHDSGSSYVFLVATGKTVQASTLWGSVATTNVEAECVPLSATISMTAADTVHIEIKAEGLAGAGAKDMDILGLTGSTRRAWWDGYLLP